MIGFNEYVKFYEENKDKIMMSSSETYPINKENMARWKNAVIEAERVECDAKAKKDFQDQVINKLDCDTDNNKETYSLFADIFEDKIRHISFKEMIDRIQDIVIEISELVDKENYHEIYMYVEDHSEKSNTWISLLFTGFLSKNTKFLEKAKVVNNIELVYDIYRKDNKKKILVLHVDDMSYSGKQMSESFGDYLPKSSEDFCPLHDTKKTENLHYYICVSFIGSSAIKLFEERGLTNLKIFKNTEIIKSFIDQVKDYICEKGIKDPEDNIRKIIKFICSGNEFASSKNGFGLGYTSFQCYKSMIPVYFDHKVADSLSTFQKILHFGSVPTTNKTGCQNIPLIQGCEGAIDSAKNEETKALNGKHCFNLLIDLDQHDTCPQTFYKRFSYTYNSETVPKNENVVKFIKSKMTDTGATPLSTGQVVNILENKHKGGSKRRKKLNSKRRKKLNSKRRKKLNSKRRKKLSSKGGSGTADSFVPNIMSQMKAMGIEVTENAARRAAIKNSDSIERAVDWLFTHQSDSDINDPLPVTDSENFSCDCKVSDLSVGDKIKGYKILEKITTAERGGQVFKVEKEGKIFALKETNNPKEKEYLTIAGAPKIHETFKFKDYDRYCDIIIMEYYQLSLKEYLVTQKNELTPDIQSDLLKKLEDLHSKGLLHNYATTSNWMSAGDTNFVLIDYGDAEQKDDITPEDKKGDLEMLYNSLKYSCNIKDNAMEIILQKL